MCQGHFAHVALRCRRENWTAWPGRWNDEGNARTVQDWWVQPNAVPRTLCGAITNKSKIAAHKSVHGLAEVVRNPQTV